MDERLALWINEPVGRWPLFDQVITTLSGASLIKMGPLLALVVAIWFMSADSRYQRARILSGMAGVFFALLTARVLQKVLPMSERPQHGLTDIALPASLDRSAFAGWSSFPSDNATITFAVSTVVFMQNRVLGIVAFTWSVAIVIFPRLYLGLHYPSDVIAGCLIGAGLVILAARLLSSRLGTAVDAMKRRPDLSAPLAFLYLFALGTMFIEVRELISILVNSLS